MNSCLIIGYSGHAYVMIDAMLACKIDIAGYCEAEEKKHNPFNLLYLGKENKSLLSTHDWTIGIGDNRIREKIVEAYGDLNLVSIIHTTSFISEKSSIGLGSFINVNATVNAFSKIGMGCILNTGSIVEHECMLSDFVHVAPGATLAGNVSVGKRSFIGANSVIKQGVSIGSDVIIGAGSVVISDIESGAKVVGNPSRRIE